MLDRDLDARFRGLDAIRPPEAWPDLDAVEVPVRRERLPRRGPGRDWRRPVAALAALALAAAGIAFAAWSFRRAEEPSPAAPVGGWIAFASDGDGDGEIYLASPAGGGLTKLTDNTGRDGSPAWSPDGSRIAFVSDRDGNSEIYVMNADGTGVRRLTEHAAEDTEPAWSPDGSRIGFTTDRDLDLEIYVMDADGGGPTNLTGSPETDDSAPAWAPDGTRIAFVRAVRYERMAPEPVVGIENIPQVHVMDLRSGTTTQLTAVLSSATHPAWSPDGSRIALEGDGDIYVMNADGSSLVRLSQDPPPGTSNRHPHPTYGNHAPAWSRDGGRIVFASDREGDRDLYLMDADGDEAEAASLVAGPGDDTDPAWQPAPEAIPATEEATASPSPEASASPEPEDGSFHPATYREGDLEVMPVIFPDGTTAELVYPPELDLAGLNVYPITHAHLENRRCGSELFTTRGDPRNELRGDAPLAVYEGTQEQSVELWRADPAHGGTWLVFRFGSWTVLLHCPEESEVNPEELVLWARSVSGVPTPEGFLVLESEPPVEMHALGGTGAPALYFSGRDILIELLVGSGDCAVDPNDREGDTVQWCIQPEGSIYLYANAFAPEGAEILRAIVDGLEVRNVRTSG